MKYEELLKLKKGDIVICKKTKEKFFVSRLIKCWDGIPPNLTREHLEVYCLKDLHDDKGLFRCFEAKDIIKV